MDRTAAVCSSVRKIQVDIVEEIKFMLSPQFQYMKEDDDND